MLGTSGHLNQLPNFKQYMYIYSKLFFHLNLFSLSIHGIHYYEMHIVESQTQAC